MAKWNLPPSIVPNDLLEICYIYINHDIFKREKNVVVKWIRSKTVLPKWCTAITIKLDTESNFPH